MKTEVGSQESGVESMKCKFQRKKKPKTKYQIPTTINQTKNDKNFTHHTGSLSGVLCR